tara:strand:- start:632 stop:778 length:147 start_codon:yes stop_codon:yes gene_type:complete
VVRWSVYDDGLRVWVDGKLVATIPPQDLPYVMKAVAAFVSEHVSIEEK